MAVEELAELVLVVGDVLVDGVLDWVVVVEVDVAVEVDEVEVLEVVVEAVVDEVDVEEAVAVVVVVVTIDDHENVTVAEISDP